jgi:hypothetical protein
MAFDDLGSDLATFTDSRNCTVHKAEQSRTNPVVWQARGPREHVPHYYLTDFRVKALVPEINFKR